MIYVFIILIFIGFLCVVIPMLIAQKYENKYNKYTSVVYKEAEYLPDSKKKLFTEMEVSYLRVLASSIGERGFPFARIFKRIKYYKTNIIWMEENLHEIDYFKLKNRERSFKDLEI
tara:strand:- start:3385 stop:3732 length:348 start_codon:yes stop_codon:yes gene_type:complete